MSTHETKFLLTGQDKTKVAFGSVSARLKGLGGAVTGLQGRLLALVGVGGFGLLISGLIDTNKQFQTLKSSLKTVTGSVEAADTAFDMIEKFAISTPFELEEVVQSFIKLKALGLDPSEDAMRSYGNTASAMGKSLDQLIEAVADAATGEFERLKEFGIKSKKQGDQVSFTFQGVTTTIGNSAAEITGYLEGIGNNQFATGMSDQMQNLGAAFSNFSGAIKAIEVQIGEAGVNDLIRDLTLSATDFITSLDPKQVEAFTHSALNGFADILEGADKALGYLDSSPYLTEAGIIGYMLFGKKGLAAVLAGQALVDGIAGATASIGESFIPSAGGINSNAEIEGVKEDTKKLQTQALTATGESLAGLLYQIELNNQHVERLSKQHEFARDYQLGDFQASQNTDGLRKIHDGYYEQISTGIRGGDQFADEIRKGNKDSDVGAKVDESNGILKDIAEAIRAQTNVATAG
jgi:hypothetical protein